MRTPAFTATGGLFFFRLVMSVAVCLAFGASEAQARHPEHLHCHVHEHSEGEVSERKVLRHCESAQPLALGEAGARTFLLRHAWEIGLKLDLSDLAVAEYQESLGAVRTRFEHVLLGLPVHDSEVSINQALDGEVLALYSNYRALTPSSSAVPTLDAAAAESVAIAAAGSVSSRLPSASQLVWYPLPDGSAQLAWRLTVYSGEPLGDFLTLVDAHSGKLLFQENRIAFDTGSGLVHLPTPVQTSGNSSLSDNGDSASAALNAERVNVTLLGLDAGVGTLKGEYVDLVSLAGGLAVPDADEPTRVYNYERSDDRFEQVTIYHSIDSIQRYFHSLGFDDDVGAANGIRDFPTLANAHWYTQDQSFYSTGDDAVHFGDGGVDDGEDADIIAHEYGHAVQHDQNACWGGGEMGAMGEAFGDYLAASFYADDGDVTFQASHAACVGEWDATSYGSTTPPCLRRVDGNKMYPTDLVGQVHADGEIWSRALWDIRTAIGGTTADQLVLEHHFTVPCNATMPDAANELIQADANLNAGVNEAAIRVAFCDRGILSGAACIPPSGLSLAYAISPDPAVAGQVATFTLTASNSSASTIAAVVLSATVPAGSSYVAASASDSGTESAGTITWPSLDISSGAVVQRTFQVLVDPGAGTSILFSDDMESGTAAWTTSHGSGTLDWALGTTNPHKHEHHVEPIAAKAASCAGGMADIYPCENVDLHTYMPIATIGGGAGSDGWGWTDSLTGTEYILMGRSSGTSFIDISDPANPVYLGDLPTHTVNSDWRDIKVYNDHAFIVSEASGHGMQVFDLTQLRSVTTPPVTFSATAHYPGFSNAHNLWINEATGFAYAVGTSVCSGGLTMIDISTPTSPVSAGCFSADGYTHDVECVTYAGPDTAHVGKEICLASNEDTVTIVDVTNKGAPMQLSRSTYAGSGYTHQGVLSADQAYFLVDDELDEQNLGHNTKTWVWDVSDLEAPVLVGSHLSSLPAIDHNQYIKDGFVYQANYQAGLRILKIEDLATADLCEVASFDVYPSSDGAAFNGAWNVYPFFASGVVAVHAIEGLAIVQPQLAGLTCPVGPPAAEHAWFASDPSVVSDQYLAMTTPVAITPGTELQFWHDFLTENSYDGGVVEYSTNGGVSWTDIGALITQNGYTGTISTSFSSPIGGRQAFEGTSSGYIQTLADLSSLAGQSVQVRFRMASDSSVSSTGWYVDDVIIGSTVSLSSTAQSTGGASESVNLVASVVAGGGNSDPVVSVNAGLVVDEGASAVIGTAQLQVTDADVGDTLTYTVTAPPASGSLNLGTSFTQAQIDANALSYTQDGSEVTSDGFTFTVSDGAGGTIGSTVFVITVTPTNDAPVLAVNTGATVLEAGSVVIGNTELQVTDADAGDTLTYTVTSAPASGSLNLGTSFTQAQIDANALSYTQDGSEVTSDSFTFTVSDGNGGSIGATVFAITVTPTNDNPVLAVNTGATVDEAGSVVIGNTELQVTDADAGDTLTYTVTSAPASGSLNLGTSFTQAQIDANALSYTQDGSEVTSDSFTFTVSDGNGGSIGATVFAITVTPVNDAPVLAVNAGAVVAEGAAVTIGSAQLQATDADPGTTLTFTVTSAPSSGALNLASSFTQADIDLGNLNYTQDGSEVTSDAFSFTVSDGNGGSIGSTVFAITVTPVNDAPSLGLASLPDATEGVLYSVLITPTDPDVGDVLTVTLVGGPGWIEPLVDNGNGTWTLEGVPQPGDAGNRVVTLRVTDSGTPVLDEQLALDLLVLSSGPVAVPTLGFWFTCALMAILATLGAHRATSGRRISQGSPGSL